MPTNDDPPRRAKPVAKVTLAKPPKPRGDDESDDEDDRPVPRKRSKRSKWVTVLVVLVCAVPAVGCGVSLVSLFAYRKAHPEWAAEMDRKSAEMKKEQEKAQEQKEAATKVYPRRKFENLVIGQLPDEVIRRVGKPSSTQEIGTTSYWYYHFRTKDGVTGNIDWQAQVVFDGSFVKNVNYH